MISMLVFAISDPYEGNLTANGNPCTQFNECQSKVCYQCPEDATPVCHSGKDMTRVMRKPTFWFPTWSDTNQAVQLQKIARG